MLHSREKKQHVLEIHGPRGQIWRSANGVHWDLLKEAIELASHDRKSEAITKAQDLWIAKNSDMHGVSFRIRTTIEIVSSFSPNDLGPESIAFEGNPIT